MYSILLNEIVVRNTSYCNLSLLLSDSYLFKGQSFLGNVITKLKIQYMIILTIVHLRFTLHVCFMCVIEPFVESCFYTCSGLLDI